MIGPGLNLVDTRFSNVKLRKTTSPGFPEIIYEVFRCSHAHGEEVPPSFSVTISKGPFLSHWTLTEGELHMPDRVVWALLAVAVFAEVNRGEKSAGNYYLSLGTEQFRICDHLDR
jgi:hypothetical protein